MNERQLKSMFNVGDIAIVKHDLSKTDRTYTATPEMYKLIGQEVKIDRVKWSNRHDEPLIVAGGWSWHPNDLYVIEHNSKSPLVVDMPQKDVLMFDFKNL